MINIHQEVTIDVDGSRDHTLTLWLVSYGSPRDDKTMDMWPAVVELLRRVCAKQGWLLECGGDPYSEKSLALFAEGFAWPDDRLEDEGQYLPYGEEEEDGWSDGPF
jgi:hypothetical protein